MPNPVSNFLDQFFQAINPIAHPDQARFDAEMALKRQEFDQHTQQFSQEQALREKEFGQRQDYQNLLEQQRKDTLKETANKNTSAALDKLSLAGAQYLPTPTGPITAPATIAGQAPAPPPGMPSMGMGVGQVTTPTEFQGPSGYNKVPTPPELAQYPGMQGQSIYLPNEEEKARQLAAGKRAEVEAGQPVWTQQQHDALEKHSPGMADILGLSPGQHYDPSLRKDLIDHLTPKDKEPKEPNAAMLPFESFAKAKGLKPDGTPYTAGDLTPAEISKVQKAEANAKQNDMAVMMAQLNAQSKQEKLDAQQKAGQTFGARVAADPKADIPKDLETQEAVEDYMQKNFGAHAPAKLGQRAESTEDFASRSIQAVDYVNRMLDNPRLRAAIEKRGGPGWGRVGNLEQEIGKGYNLTDDERQIIQAFRSQLNYTRFQEGQALFGGRIPIQLMNELSSTSPRIQQARAEMKGALKAVKDNAQGTLVSYAKERYGATPPDPWFAAKDIPKKNFVDNKLTRVPDQLQDMEAGEQRMVTDSKKNQSMIVRHQDGSFTERPVE